MFLFKNWVVILGFVLLSSVLSTGAEKAASSENAGANATPEDALDEGKVESEGEEPQQSPQPGVASDSASQPEEPASGSTGSSGNKPLSGPLGASPQADAVVLFVKPAMSRYRDAQGVSVPAGKPVNVLVGFNNRHTKDEGKSFVLNSIEASFRYPQEYSYSLQNFTVLRMNQEVEAMQEATVEYSFTPSAHLAGRPFGLMMVLQYHDTDSKQYVHAVFNETVNVVEVDEGFDGETFFMYVFVLVMSVLLLFGVYHLMVNYGSKKLALKGLKKQLRSATGGDSEPVEMGTSVNGDVDFNWLPKHTLDQMKANRSPKTSPRLRKVKRNGGADGVE